MISTVSQIQRRYSRASLCRQKGNYRLVGATACEADGTSGAIARAWAFEFGRDGGISAAHRPKYQGRCRDSECEIIVPVSMSKDDRV